MTTIRLNDLLNDINIIFKDDDGAYYSLKWDSEIHSGFDDSIVTVILKKDKRLSKKTVIELD